MGESIQIRHRTMRGTIGGMPHTVPILSKPIRSFDRFGKLLERKCPTCGVHHPCKTVHLWLDDTGACLVSSGVLDDLRLAGMPNLDTVGASNVAPSIEINKPRAIVDRNNRAIRPLVSMKASIV